ncbi:hypothetical protein OV079_09165 [Nannocystis pusilla]|uniref:Uncharacterized protein n=1 Tax=Nannocystis pusilla TaxID=889268 RepID=A0A9X3EM59_9BACT|nr:hypothetical protein [Nannocystis pusilla]MCY1005730.1 hypothetical protein [Nannocystis pusilla]
MAFNLTRHALQNVVAIGSYRDHWGCKRDDSMPKDTVEKISVSRQDDFQPPHKSFEPVPACHSVDLLIAVGQVIVYASACRQKAEKAVVPRLLLSKKPLEEIENLLVFVSSFELLGCILDLHEELKADAHDVLLPGSAIGGVKHLEPNF